MFDLVLEKGDFYHLVEALGKLEEPRQRTVKHH